jgi:hypothetical protein
LWKSLRLVAPASLLDDYRGICVMLEKLLAFVVLNAEGLRKALKKHDKNVLYHRITGEYLTTRVSTSPDSHLRQLYYHNGIDAIFKSLTITLDEMPSLSRTPRERGGK